MCTTLSIDFGRGFRETTCELLSLAPSGVKNANFAVDDVVLVVEHSLVRFPVASRRGCEGTPRQTRPCTNCCCENEGQ